ncbi:MAG: Type 1 glutamine amidotransferase-like domain-containing protein [Patescibacteria group bacterium]
MLGTLALVGSGEFTPAMEEVDRFLLSHIKTPKVAILPTAAGQEPDYYKWIEKGIAHFSGLGIEAHGIPIIARDDAHRLAKKLHEFNFYYFSGGNPGYLLGPLCGVAR